MDSKIEVLLGANGFLPTVFATLVYNCSIIQGSDRINRFKFYCSKDGTSDTNFHDNEVVQVMDVLLCWFGNKERARKRLSWCIRVTIQGEWNHSTRSYPRISFTAKCLRHIMDFTLNKLVLDDEACSVMHDAL
jgi:hypothetical protein